MASIPSRRAGQAVIEDVKTVAIVILAAFLLGSIVAILNIVGSGMNEGFAEVDGARLYAGVTGLIGEQHAISRVDLMNEYGTITVDSGELTFSADFMDDDLSVGLPQRYSYESAEFSGEDVCIIKQGTDITVTAPPCR